MILPIPAPRVRIIAHRDKSERTTDDILYIAISSATFVYWG